MVFGVEIFSFFLSFSPFCSYILVCYLLVLKNSIQFQRISPSSLRKHEASIVTTIFVAITNDAKMHVMHTTSSVFSFSFLVLSHQSHHLSTILVQCQRVNVLFNCEC